MDTKTTSRAQPMRPNEPVDPAKPCCADRGGAASAAPPTLDGSLDVTQTATLADRLKALADPTRLHMLDLLAQQSVPLCVCEITDQFAQQQPTISHHLRILRQAGLIVGERRGTWAYYSATDAGRRGVSLAKTLL